MLLLGCVPREPWRRTGSICVVCSTPIFPLLHRHQCRALQYRMGRRWWEDGDCFWLHIIFGDYIMILTFVDMYLMYWHWFDIVLDWGDVALSQWWCMTLLCTCTLYYVVSIYGNRNILIIYDVWLIIYALWHGMLCDWCIYNMGCCVIDVFITWDVMWLVYL